MYLIQTNILSCFTPSNTIVGRFVVVDKRINYKLKDNDTVRLHLQVLQYEATIAELMDKLMLKDAIDL